MLLSIEDAREEVLRRAAPLPGRSLPLDEALGCVLASDAIADLDAPPFDKALVDGYAVRSVDAAGGVERYEVVEEVMAGRCPTRPLSAGRATLVMTGAPLPEGADAVVMHEKTRRDGAAVEIGRGDVAPGWNLLPRGRELRAGEVVLRAGSRLTPTRLGLLATIGCDPVQARPKPVVSVLPTGDELVEPGATPGPGQIRNSNGVLLHGLVEESGCRARLLRTAPDLVEPLRERLREGLDAEVLLVTGGVSAGKLDLVPDALASLGVERVFHKVRLKPGKPLWFGVGPGSGDRPRTLVFGLPGNPVGAVVGFLLFVRPALRALAGFDPSESESECECETRNARLTIEFNHRGDRPTYHPAVLRRDASGERLVEPLDWAGSADLRTVASADGFAVFPAGERRHAAGEIVSFLPLRPGCPPA